MSLSFCPVHRYFFCFAIIMNEFWWNLREVIAATNRLDDNILGEIWTILGEIGTRRSRYDRKLESTSSVFLPRWQTRADTWRMNSQISHHTQRQMRARTLISITLMFQINSLTLFYFHSQYDYTISFNSRHRHLHSSGKTLFSVGFQVMWKSLVMQKRMQLQTQHSAYLSLRWSFLSLTCILVRYNEADTWRVKKYGVAAALEINYMLLDLL